MALRLAQVCAYLQLVEAELAARMAPAAVTRQSGQALHWAVSLTTMTGPSPSPESRRSSSGANTLDTLPSR